VNYDSILTNRIINKFEFSDKISNEFDFSCEKLDEFVQTLKDWKVVFEQYKLPQLAYAN